MSVISTTPAIVETSRGPCIAGTRITVYAILDYLHNGLGLDAVKENFRLSDEQLGASLEYIEQHRAELERDYAEIVRRSNGRREFYEQAYRARSPFGPELPLAEKSRLMRRDLSNKRPAKLQPNGNQDPARPQSRRPR